MKCRRLKFSVSSDNGAQKKYRKNQFNSCFGFREIASKVALGKAFTFKHVYLYMGNSHSDSFT